MSQYYNNEIKEKYLDTYENKSTRDVMSSVFVKSLEIEKQLEKDLYDFSIDEIKDVLYNLDASTGNSIRSSGSYIKYYIDWAIKNELRGNLNPLRYNPPSWYNQFIDKSKKILFSEEEINDMISHLVNAQDSIILQLVFFEGLEGDSLSELLDLRREDIDFENNTLKLADRTVKVSEKSISLINAALREDVYLLKNGEAKGWKKEAPLLQNDYVIRSTQGKAINLEKADKHLVYRRIATISEYFDYKYLNIKNISKSGMLKMAKDLYLRDGELDKKQLDEIAEKFDTPKAKVGDVMLNNYYALKEFINMENIEKLYPEIF
jgi:integrase